MNTFYSIEEFIAFFDAQKNTHGYAGTCVTIGNFDGVHMGHQALLRRTAQKAQEHNLLPIVLTFWPHPLTVLASAHAPFPLTEREDRAKLVMSHGIGAVLELEFTKDIAALNPDEFIQKVLCPICCKELVVGYDFSLGKGRTGNFEILTELGTLHGFNVERLAPVILHNAVVSSTRIRNMVRTGEVYEIEALLGRYYYLDGSVIHGYGRGEGLGFPTANLEVGQTLVPKLGVYATLLSVLNSPKNALGEAQTPLCTYPAVTNVGHVPTFGNNALSIESFILQGNPVLYGAKVRLFFVQYIREEQQFANIGELTKRIAKDVQLSKEILDIEQSA